MSNPNVKFSGLTNIYPVLGLFILGVYVPKGFQLRIASYSKFLIKYTKKKQVRQITKVKASN